MKKTARILAFLMALLMFVSLFGCAAEKPATAAKKTHDRYTHISPESGESICHEFVDGKCVRCEETTPFRQVPLNKSKEILLTEQEKQGTVEYFWYKTRAYAVEEYETTRIQNGEASDYKIGDELYIWKRAYIYLPYGYNKDDTSKKYNVLYLAHGDKLNEGYWFREGAYAENDGGAFTGGYGTDNMLDYMMSNGLAEETIVIGLTQYQYYEGEYSGDPANPTMNGGTKEMGNVYSGYVDPETDKGYRLGWIDASSFVPETHDDDEHTFYLEWKNYLMPYVVEHYNTFANSTSEEDLIAARDHVAFGGICRGGKATINILSNCLRYVSYYVFMSTALPLEEDVPAIKKEAETYPIHYLFASWGSQENPNVEDAAALKIATQLGLQFGSDISKGDNYEFVSINGTAHNYATWITDLYNFFLVGFKK